MKTLKKLSLACATFVMCITLMSCGGSKNENNNSDSSSESSESYSDEQSSSEMYGKTWEFSSPESVLTYLKEHRFRGKDNVALSVNSDWCLTANGEPISAAIRITEYSATLATFEATNPVNHFTMHFMVDSEKGTLFYFDDKATYEVE